MATELTLDPRVLATAITLLVVFFVLYLTFSGFSMVGITPGEVIVVLFIAPFLALVNIPVWREPGVVFGINAAGFFIPVVLSIRFVMHGRLPLAKAVIGTTAVTVVAFLVARVDPERGVLVPAFVLVAVALVVGLAVSAGRWREVGPAVYASGALGTLIGADLLHMHEMIDPSRSEPLFAVIGGAGTLDAIYLIALMAVFGAIVVVAVMRVLERSARSG